jgi:hypothetical protein
MTQHVAHRASDEIARLNARIDELCATLIEAREMVEFWGAYADTYFRNKHDFDGDIAKLNAVANQAMRSL